MHLFTSLFLLFFAASLGMQIWLKLRQIHHIRRHRDSVPTAFQEAIEQDAHSKAADYTIAKTRMSFWSIGVGAAVMLGLLFGGGINLLDRLWGETGWHAYFSGCAVILSVLMINSIMDIPISAWETFRIEEKFGFNRMTPGLFIADILKAFLLLLLIGAPLIIATLWFMNVTGEWWWLWVWGLWMSFSLLLTWAYPAFIAPLFNKFLPLQDEELKGRIEKLLQRCGFRNSGIYVMDGSRRSAHGNAYFTGMGRSKRIVFFDTLMKDLDHDQIEAVLAHELGHFKLHHIVKRLVISASTTLASLALLGWLSEEPWFYSGLGIETPSNHAALLIFLLALPVFTYLLTPLSSLYSRRHEFEADEFAVEHADGRALISALVVLYRENASTLTPDPVHSAFYDSHPPAPVRITRLLELVS